jgi:hypothetical protein
MDQGHTANAGLTRDGVVGEPPHRRVDAVVHGGVPGGDGVPGDAGGGGIQVRLKYMLIVEFYIFFILYSILFVRIVLVFLFILGNSVRGSSLQP